MARDLTALGSARKMVAGFVSIEADQRAAEDRAARAAAASSSDDSLIGDTTSEDASMRDQREAVRPHQAPPPLRIDRGALHHGCLRGCVCGSQHVLSQRGRIDNKSFRQIRRFRHVQRLRQVFHDMDRNGDGFLNIGEFRAAMDSLGDHLDGATVAKICLALDIHGRMDFEDFHMIVDEEFMRSASKESLQLRHTLHKLSDSDFKHWLGSP